MIIEEITENSTQLVTRKLSSPDDEYSYFLSQGEKYHKASEDFRDTANDDYSRLRCEFSQEELEKYSKEEKNDLKKQYAEIAYGFYLQACSIADKKRLNENLTAEISIRKSLANVAYLRGDIFQAQLFALNAVDLAYMYVKKSSNSLLRQRLWVKDIKPPEVKQYYILLLTELYFFLEDMARNNPNEFPAKTTIDNIKENCKIYRDTGYIDMEQLSCDLVGGAVDEIHQLILNSPIMRLPPVNYDESNKRRIRRTRFKEYAKVAAVFGIGAIFIGVAIAWQIGNIFFPLMGDFLPAVPGAVWGALGLVVSGAIGLFALYRGNKRLQKTKKTIQDMKDVDDLIEKAFQWEKEPQQFAKALVEMEFTKESLRLMDYGHCEESVDKLLKYGVRTDNIAYLVFLVAKISISRELKQRATQLINDERYSNSLDNESIRNTIESIGDNHGTSLLEGVLQRLENDKKLNPTKYKNAEKYLNEMTLIAHVMKIWLHIYNNQPGGSPSSWNECRSVLQKEKNQQRLTAIFSSLLAINAPGELDVPRMLQVLSPRFVELKEQVNQKEVIHPDRLLEKADSSSPPMKQCDNRFTKGKHANTEKVVISNNANLVEVVEETFVDDREGQFTEETSPLL